jgi:ABC-type phosphate transport system substrate-binding protein
MKVLAEGWIDIGGSSRELGRVADANVSSHLDTGLRYAAAFGLYSETFTRLVAALAARQLNGGGSDTVMPAR